MATDGPDPVPCDTEVYEHGEVVYIERRGLSSNRMESWVQKVAARSGQRVDWHYVGGIPVVKAIGDIGAVKKAMADLKIELDNLYAEYHCSFKYMRSSIARLPRKLKKALAKPTSARTIGEKKRVAAYIARGY